MDSSERCSPTQALHRFICDKYHSASGGTDCIMYKRLKETKLNMFRVTSSDLEGKSGKYVVIYPGLDMLLVGCALTVVMQT